MKPVIPVLLLLLSLPFLILSSFLSICTISNCAVHFICHDCPSQNICSSNSSISDLTIRPNPCTIYQSGLQDNQQLCEQGCRYCFSQTKSGQIFQICTICDDNYELLNGQCYPIQMDMFAVDVLYQSTEDPPLTTNYIAYEDNTPVTVIDKLATNYEFSVKIKVLTSILAIGMLVYVVYCEYQPFVRFMLFIQHLYHFSFKGFALPKSQYFISFMNIFNIGFMNNIFYFLPDSYVEINDSKTYFILNIDHNLLRNTGGSLFVYLIILAALAFLFVFQSAKKKMVLAKYNNKLLTLWLLVQNNLMYFSIFCLIKVNDMNTNSRIAMGLRITSGFIILLYLCGVFIIYKLFTNSQYPKRIQKYQLLTLILYHLLINILLCFGQKSISQYFVLLIHVLYISLTLYYLKHKATHHKSKARFVLSQWFSFTLYISILLDIEQGVLIGEVIAYLLMNMWDVVLTKGEMKTIEELEEFKNGGGSVGNQNPGMILMTDGDFISYPTMKKFYSSASTES